MTRGQGEAGRVSAGTGDGVVSPHVARLAFQEVHRLRVARLDHGHEKISNRGDVFGIEDQPPGRNAANPQPENGLAEQVVLLLRVQRPALRHLVRGKISAALTGRPLRRVGVDNQGLPSPIGGGPVTHPSQLGDRGHAASQALDPAGWLHSGDMGYLRPDGYLVFMGRYKDMLKIGGENVDPMEVEGYLLGHPGIQQVAVVGLPDPRLHEVPVAFVIPKAGAALTPEDVLAFCRGKIASFKAPRHVLLVQELPMTSSGKIQKAKLREAAKERIPARPPAAP